MTIYETSKSIPTAGLCSMPDHGSASAEAACCRPSSPTFMGQAASTRPAAGFWHDRANWWRASKNTLNCVIGCSIGDFGMLFYLQFNYPKTPVFLAIALAMATGLLTSVIFEATILKLKEGFPWAQAIKVAISMSFISMLGMELAENLTDYALTGGVSTPSEAWFWVALIISLIVGFLAPLPYNYYKLKKFGKACH